MLRPGETVHYVALLDEQGEILATIPMDHPPHVPKYEGIVNANVEVKVNVHLEIGARGKVKC